MSHSGMKWKLPGAESESRVMLEEPPSLVDDDDDDDSLHKVERHSQLASLT